MNEEQRSVVEIFEEAIKRKEEVENEVKMTKDKMVVEMVKEVMVENEEEEVDKEREQDIEK